MSETDESRDEHTGELFLKWAAIASLKLASSLYN